MRGPTPEQLMRIGQIRGWRVDYSTPQGAVMLYRPQSDLDLYATPDWSDPNTVALQVATPDTEDVAVPGLAELEAQPCVWTGDMDQDCARWKQRVEAAITIVEAWERETGRRARTAPRETETMTKTTRTFDFSACGQEHVTVTGRFRSYGGWRAGQLDLGRYLRPGDTVDSRMCDYLLEVVPPAHVSGSLLQCGEPNHHDHEGKARYATLQRSGGAWVFTGYQRAGQHTRIQHR